MKSVASNDTQAVIKNFPVFAGRNKESFQEYKSKREYHRIFLTRWTPCSTTAGLPALALAHLG